MIVDSSALVSIVLDEEDGPRMATAIINAEIARISSATWFETTIAVDRRRNADLTSRFNRPIYNLGMEVVPFDQNQAEIARNAFGRYGKEMHNKAKLNYGDCMSYALAKAKGEPLLFKGNDFIHTDIKPAPY